MEKKKETYNLEQIITVIEDIYAVDASEDSWGLRVIYKPSLVKSLKARLKQIKQYVK